jgi:hypothetical protein
MRWCCRRLTAVTAADDELLTNDGGNMMYQSPGLWGGPKQSGMSTRRLKLWATILVFGGVATVFGDRMASADELISRGPVRLMYTVTEEGDTFALWAPGVPEEGETVTHGKGVLPVPADLVGEIERILANPEQYPGRLEYIIVLKGSLKAVKLCHIHNGESECHPPG